MKLSETDEFADVGRAVESMCKGLRERQMLKEAMAGYHSRAVAEPILACARILTWRQSPIRNPPMRLE